jgi:hypothetical protein
MPTLVTMLRQYPNDWVLNRYLHCSRESWCIGGYYLGGQMKLGIDDEITWQHLADVTSIHTEAPQTVSNNWEMASIQRSEQEFSHFRDLYTDYLRIKKFNGLLRAIIFWLSPARKRATEKVFHPDNLIIQYDDCGFISLVPKKSTAKTEN